MSTAVVEQPCRAGMATSSTLVTSQAAIANGTNQMVPTAAQETIDADVIKQEDEDTVCVKSSDAAHMHGKAQCDDGVSIQCTVETAMEMSRKRVKQAKRRLQVQMQFVKHARRRILDETHPDMVERLQVAVQERDHLLRVAKQRYDSFEHGTAVVYNYGCDEANSEYDLQCEKLRQDMLEEIHHEMEILNDQCKGGHSHARTTTRKTRSTRTKACPEAGFVPDTAQKNKKRAGHVFQPLENKLGQSEIDHDVRELTSIYEATAKRRMDFGIDCDVTPVAKFYRNKFLYRDWIFQEGDEVYVLNHPASSEYAAVICGISPTELFVLSEKGKHDRIIIMDVRQGRVVLTTLSSEQAASRDNRGNVSP